MVKNSNSKLLRNLKIGKLKDRLKITTIKLTFNINIHNISVRDQINTIRIDLIDRISMTEKNKLKDHYKTHLKKITREVNLNLDQPRERIR
jgi:hypothetical protein